jgi:hypothetical protein
MTIKLTKYRNLYSPNKELTRHIEIYRAVKEQMHIKRLHVFLN